MSKSRPTYKDIEKRLSAAEPIVEALKNHEVDAVVGDGKVAILLLRGVQDTLLECNETFSAMFELGGVGMVQLDTPALHFSRVNRKFCEIIGYSPEELLTRTYIGLTHPLDRRRGMKELSRVLRAEVDTWSMEKRCVRKDGSIVWVEVHGALLRDTRGRAVRILAMIADITARKRAEPGQRERAATKRKPNRLKKARVKTSSRSASNLSAKPSRVRRR